MAQRLGSLRITGMFEHKEINMEKLIVAMEEFLTESGYVKVSGEGLGGKWKVPKGSVYVGDVMYLKRCVDHHIEHLTMTGKVNSAHV
jgi:hypothetical protein